MNLKLIVAFVGDEHTAAVVDAAREAGATGATVITSCRGEGLKPEKTFLGLDLSAHRDVLLFLVVEARPGFRRYRHVAIGPGTPAAPCIAGESAGTARSWYGCGLIVRVHPRG